MVTRDVVVRRVRLQGGVVRVVAVAMVTQRRVERDADVIVRRLGILLLFACAVLARGTHVIRVVVLRADALVGPAALHHGRPEHTAEYEVEQQFDGITQGVEVISQIPQIVTFVPAGH